MRGARNILFRRNECYRKIYIKIRGAHELPRTITAIKRGVTRKSVFRAELVIRDKIMGLEKALDLLDNRVIHMKSLRQNSIKIIINR